MIITTLPYLFPLKPGKVYHNGEYFLFTLAALVVTLPITIYHFQRLSLVALLANPLVLPSQPAVMVLGGLAVLLGWVSLSLGKLAALFAWPFTAYTIRAVELLARIPGGNLVLGPMGLLVVALAYALLFAGTWAVVHRPAWMVGPEAEASSRPRGAHRPDGLGLADGPGCSGRPAAPGALGRGQR